MFKTGGGGLCSLTSQSHFILSAGKPKGKPAKNAQPAENRRMKECRMWQSLPKTREAPEANLFHSSSHPGRSTISATPAPAKTLSALSTVFQQAFPRRLFWKPEGFLKRLSKATAKNGSSFHSNWRKQKDSSENIPSRYRRKIWPLKRSGAPTKTTRPQKRWVVIVSIWFPGGSL